MNRIASILALSVLFAACNENNGSTEQKIDSLERRIDTTAEKVWDSTKAKAKELKDRIEQRFDNRDSTVRRDTL
jgi:hypothetical protein